MNQYLCTQLSPNIAITKILFCKKDFNKNLFCPIDFCVSCLINFCSPRKSNEYIENKALILYIDRCP